MDMVVLLLVVIVVLLCFSQADRGDVLAVWVGVGILGTAIYYVGPIILALVFLSGQRFGWLATLGIAEVVVFVGVLLVAALLDAKHNRAVRAGSQEAFKRRIEDYVRVFGYSREKAIETATRFRNGK